MKNNLENIDSEIGLFDSFKQDRIKEIIDVDALNNELTNLEADYERAKTANDEEEIITIATALFELKIPKSISLSETADDLSFYFDENKVNVDLVNSITNGNGTSDYDEAIVAWSLENVEMKLDYDKFYAQYENGGETILRTFEITASRKTTLDYDYYLILKKVENMKFEQSYSREEEGEYVYIKIVSDSKNIVFSTTEEIDFEDLVVFTSPAISKLAILKEDVDDKPFLWTWFGLVLAVILIVGFVVYIVLQEWYKRKYENHLFKNRNDMYNIISYVNNMRSKKLTDSKIGRSLKKAGWGGEQVRYALRKYAGKRTGMVEIPVKKVLSKLTKKDAPKPSLSQTRMSQRRANPKRFRRI